MGTFCNIVKQQYCEQIVAAELRTWKRCGLYNAGWGPVQAGILRDQ
jgi:hypothetical protein